MTDQRMIQILRYLLDLADEYGIPWMDFFSDEYQEYEKEVEPMTYWDTIMFLADKQLAADWQG